MSIVGKIFASQASNKYATNRNVGGKFGAGRHVWVIELENLTMIFKV